MLMLFADNNRVNVDLLDLPERGSGSENNSSTSREHVLHTVMLLFREYVDGIMMNEVDDQEASWKIKWP